MLGSAAKVEAGLNAKSAIKTPKLQQRVIEMILHGVPVPAVDKAA
jgi:hypothetical protein